ncbi:hypothetical protein RchiOBHm_Chr7g0234911 [Rosa chinensis]|uniref:Uncharacterized protein n=1 Tax=Rosa chinensis TaxID=74649 RepID=A0A2P6PGJ1_ROSCH|nr:hypothetical protein RchiOBHm_Chr7g0234911 [Rosa chinensis]
MEGEGERESEVLNPEGSGGAGVVRFGSEDEVGVDPEDNVGLEVVVLPVDVL